MSKIIVLFFLFSCGILSGAIAQNSQYALGEFYYTKSKIFMGKMVIAFPDGEVEEYEWESEVPINENRSYKKAEVIKMLTENGIDIQKFTVNIIQKMADKGYEVVSMTVGDDLPDLVGGRSYLFVKRPPKAPATDK